MLTPQAATAEASARDDLHTPHTLLARGRARARAGRVADALDDLDRAPRPGARRARRAASSRCCWRPASTAGWRAASSPPRWPSRDQLDPLLDAPGLAGATAHFGRGELAAATGDAEGAAGHYFRSGRLLVDAGRPRRPGPAPVAARRRARRGAARAPRPGRRAGPRAPGAVPASRRRRTPSRSACARSPSSTRTATASRCCARPAPCSPTCPRPGWSPRSRPTSPASCCSPAARREQDEALTLLRGAEEYAGREELWPLQGRVRRLLDRLGEPARPVPGEVLATLTASERRIAQLAAAGLTNREIADQLVVTVKAVEWHLSHVYRKLGIRSRTGLAEQPRPGVSALTTLTAGARSRPGAAAPRRSRPRPRPPARCPR